MEERVLGSRLIALAGLIGAAVSAYYYLVPGVGLDGEGGVLLVIVSCGLMVAAALGLMTGMTGGVAGLLSFLILLDIVGTSVAAYFLETPILIAAMVLALIGWLMRSMGAAANRSVEVA